jgi:hypothetical protein
MVDVDVRFNVGEDQPINAEFEVQPDVTFTADIEVETATRDHDKLFHRDYPDQHPISAITGLEEALQRANTFIFEQGIASDEWVIEHNLNKYPSVTVVDSADNTVIGYVTYDNENTITIKFNAAFKGKAYLN